jgi:hypothetical protein
LVKAILKGGGGGARTFAQFLRGARTLVKLNAILRGRGGARTFAEFSIGPYTNLVHV